MAGKYIISGEWGPCSRKIPRVAKTVIGPHYGGLIETALFDHGNEAGRREETD
jgi:hypothetical protein